MNSQRINGPKFEDFVFIGIPFSIKTMASAIILIGIISTLIWANVESSDYCEHDLMY